MEQPKATSNTVFSAGNGGKLKKWRKKGESGAIYNSTMYFTAHNQFGLNFVPTLSDKIGIKDGSRKKESVTNEVENISIQSLLELLYLVFEQDGVDTTNSTKHFEITNKGYLRYIVILCTYASASEPIAPLSMDHNGLTWRPVRLSKQVHRLVFASERLLFGSKPRQLATSEAPDCYLEGPMDAKILSSEEFQLLLNVFREDNAEVITVWSKLKPLCINAATRHLLGYPTPTAAIKSTFFPAPSAINDDNATEDEQVAKRRRVTVAEQQQSMTDNNSILTHRLQIPSLEEAQSFLSQCSSYSDGRVSFYSTISPSFIQAMRSSSSDNNRWMPTKITAVAAIDCEMVGTIHGRDEVVRITLLDRKGRVLVEEMVQPVCGLEAVNDYRTAFTGLTQPSFAELITAGKVIDLAQIQALMLSLLCSESVIIGHSLDSDLRALRISHACCVDTAVLYPHPAGPLPLRQALRSLTLKYLGRAIQQQKQHKAVAAGGHDSAEDAQAALELALMKADGENNDNDCDDSDDDVGLNEEQEEGYGDQKGDGLLRTIRDEVDNNKPPVTASPSPATMLLSIQSINSVSSSSNNIAPNNDVSQCAIPNWLPVPSVGEAMDKMDSFIHPGLNLKCDRALANQGMRLCVLQVEEGNEINNEEIDRILLQRLSPTSASNDTSNGHRPAGLLLRIRQPSTIAVRDMLQRQRQARRASSHHPMAVSSNQAAAVWGGHDERRLREMLKLVHTAAFNLTAVI